MTFEEALRSELITLSNLSNKVFPVFAPEMTSSPYVTYQKTNINFIKTMNGTSETRFSRYELDLIAQTYSELQNLTMTVKNKLISFEGRIIGTNGPFVQSVVIENVIEGYEQLPKLYRSNIEVLFYF